MKLSTLKPKRPGMEISIYSPDRKNFAEVSTTVIDSDISLIVSTLLAEIISDNTAVKWVTLSGGALRRAVLSPHQSFAPNADIDLWVGIDENKMDSHASEQWLRSIYIKDWKTNIVPLTIYGGKTNQDKINIESHVLKMFKPILGNSVGINVDIILSTKQEPYEPVLDFDWYQCCYFKSIRVSHKNSTKPAAPMMDIRNALFKSEIYRSPSLNTTGVWLPLPNMFNSDSLIHDIECFESNKGNFSSHHLALTNIRKQLILCSVHSPKRTLERGIRFAKELKMDLPIETIEYLLTTAKLSKEQRNKNRQNIQILTQNTSKQQS